MVAAFALALLLSATTPTPPASVPAAPGDGLGLESGPTVPTTSYPTPPPASSPPASSTGPAPAVVASLAAGMALLAARARRISAAEHSIRESLQDNLFSDVGSDDLRRIGHRIAGLDPSEATAAVARLSDGELGVWMRELDGWRGGLSSAEQAEHLGILAATLRPDQLARFTDHGKTEAIVAAAIGSGPEAGRVELALALWNRRSPGAEGWNAIVELVESVPPDTLGAGLTPAGIPPLARSLVEPFQPYPGAAPVVDLEAAHRLAAAGQGLADPVVKAELFRALVGEATALGRIKVVGPVKLPDLMGGLTGLLRHDAAGVVAELNHRIDPHANVTSLWVEEMILHDRFDQLDVLLAQLAGGSDRLAHFTRRGSDPANPYPHASNLGYYVAAYGRALGNIADRSEDQVRLVSHLFALFTGVVPVPGGGSVGLPLGPLVDRQAGDVIDGLQSGAAGLEQVLWGLAKPRTADGRLWNGAGTSQFQDAWQEVADVG